MNDAERLAEAIEQLRESLSGIRLDDSAQGAAADTIRANLTERGMQLDMLHSAAKAMAQAAEERRGNLADLQAQTPSDEELRAASDDIQRLSRAAAQGEATPSQVQAAIDRLSGLLDEKKRAQQTFEKREQRTAETLDGATADLPADGPLPGLAAMAPAMLSSLSQLRLPEAAPVGAPAGAEMGGGEQAADPSAADLLDELLPGADGSSSHWGGSPYGGDGSGGGAGITHVSADELPIQATVAGVQTGADVSGRSSTPPPVIPSGAGGGGAVAAGGMGAGMGGVPMAPMAPGGASPGKSQERPHIINTDPDFTGADIDARIATSGIIGRGESSHNGGK